MNGDPDPDPEATAGPPSHELLPPPPTPSPPYRQPPFQAPARRETDGLAIASLVLGILWLYWVGSILAIVFAVIAITRINRSNGQRSGKGMAIAGLVLGIVSIVTFALLALLGFAAGRAINNSNSLACINERLAVHRALDHFQTRYGPDSDPSVADLVEAGLLVEPSANFTVSSGVVVAVRGGDC